MSKTLILISGGFLSKGSEYQKSYFFTRHFKASWVEARSFCHSYGLEFLSLDTLEEARTLQSFSDNNSNLRTSTSVWLYIDGVSMSVNSLTDWYWTKSGDKISYTIPWHPGTPNNAASNEYCLTFGKASINQKFGFDDAKCDSSTFVACQRVDFFVP